MARESCSVEGCGAEAYKTISREKASKVFGSRLLPGRRVKLCKDHWKEYKKATKKDRMLEKWRWG